jgi:hypothetical protein
VTGSTAGTPAMTTSQCSTCLSSNETDDHLLQCPSPTRRAWRSDFITTIITPIESFLDPVLIDILRKGLLHYFHSKCINATQYSPRYQWLLKQQKAIGWNNFLCSKFSKEWSYLQQQHCARNNITMTNPQRQWPIKLLRTMWIRIHDLWLA